MRALLTLLLIGCAVPARAMNWEGHDDWMADAAPALLYREAVPHAQAPARPPPACPQHPSAAAANPYEQVPLDPPDCRAPHDVRVEGR